MADKTGSEQETIGHHIRNTVFATDVSALGDGEGLSVGSDIYGTIEIWTNSSATTTAELLSKWASHKESCNDGCKDWSL